MRRINEILKKMDVFGQHVFLNMGQKGTYKTTLGGYSTMILGIVFTWFCISQILKFVYNKTIYFTTDQSYDTNFEILKLTSSNFMFAVSIEQISQSFVEYPFFNLIMTVVDIEMDSDSKFIKNNQYLKLEPCTSSHWSKLPNDYEWEKEFNTLRIENFLCPPIDYEIQLQGQYNQDFFKYAKIEAIKCDINEVQNTNNWNPQRCATQSEMEDYYNSEGTYKLQFYTSNFVPNPGIDENYYSYLSTQLYFNFYPGEFYTNADIFMEKHTINQNENYFSEDSNTDPFGKQSDIIFPSTDYGKKREQIVVGESKDEALAKIFLRKYLINYYYKKDYQTLTDLISYVGGFINIILTIVRFIIQDYNRQSQYIEMASCLYQFEDDGNEETDDAKILNEQNITGKSFGYNEQYNMQLARVQNQKKRSQGSQKTYYEKKEIALKILQDYRLNPNLQLRNRNRKLPQLNRFQEIQQLNKNQDQLKQRLSVSRQLILSDKHMQSKIGKKKLINNIMDIQYQKTKEYKDSQSSSDQESNLKQSKENSGSDLQKIICSNNEKYNINQVKGDHDEKEDTHAIQIENKIEKQKELKEHNVLKQDEIHPSLQLNNKFSVKKEEKQLFSSAQSKNFLMSSMKKKMSSLSQKKVSFNEKIVSDEKNVIQGQSPHKQSQFKSQINVIKQKQQEIKLLQSKQQLEEIIDTNLLYFQQTYNIKGRKEYLQDQFESLIKYYAQLKQITPHYLIYRYSLKKLCRSRQNKLIKTGIQLVKPKLDVFALIDTMQQLEKLKTILLDENQLTLFEFQPHNVIRFSDIQAINDQLKQRQKQIEQLEDDQKKQAMNFTLSNSDKKKTTYKKTKNTESLLQNYVKDKRLVMETYKRLYQAYESIQRTYTQDKSYKDINSKLLSLLGSDLKRIFQSSELIIFDNNDKENIKKLAEKNNSQYQDMFLSKKVPQTFYDLPQKQNNNINDLKYDHNFFQMLEKKNHSDAVSGQNQKKDQYSSSFSSSSSSSFSSSSFQSCPSQKIDEADSKEQSLNSKSISNQIPQDIYRSQKQIPKQFETKNTTQFTNKKQIDQFQQEAMKKNYNDLFDTLEIQNFDSDANLKTYTLNQNLNQIQDYNQKQKLLLQQQQQQNGLRLKPSKSTYVIPNYGDLHYNNKHEQEQNSYEKE